jgi:PHD/YefM family antitoxin component YafN of YafNO toxin-antitoxin module
MTEKQYPILDAGEVGASLEKLHDQIAREYERVVITRHGSDARCVLISQAELSGLERALEILSGSVDGALMRAEVLRIAAEVEGRAYAPAGPLS